MRFMGVAGPAAGMLRQTARVVNRAGVWGGGDRMKKHSIRKVVKIAADSQVSGRGRERAGKRQ